MISLGYLYKRVVPRPEWINAEQVEDIFSLSSCVSEDFADYINYWRHNGYWLFDAPEIIQNLSVEHSISLNGLRLFYYEAYEREYNDNNEQWENFSPESSFETNVRVPECKNLEGFDVTTFYAHTSPECSPLSCNSLAAEISTNRHCLFGTFEEARGAIERGAFKNSEPGPYRIIAVYTVC